MTLIQSHVEAHVGLATTAGEPDQQSGGEEEIPTGEE
jgi:hypothetical protein